MLVAPTGSGKSHIFVFVTKGAREKGLRVLILTHRSEIMSQICRILTEWRVPHAKLTAGREIPDGYSVMVASIQTLVRRLKGSPRPDFIIQDEVHHCVSPTWLKVFAEYPNAKYLGVTATPERLDGRGLGEFYHRMVLGPKVQWLIDHGFLSRPRYFAPPKTVDLSGIKKTAGDYNRKALAGVVDRSVITGDAVEHYKRHAPGRTAIAFCISIAHAEHVAATFNAAGIRSEVIDGTMGEDQRDGIIGRVRERKTLILVSVDLVSEGFDLPAVGAVILLRPTASLALHLQQIGRGLRPAPGRTDTVVLDHVGNCHRHGLAEEEREWSLEGHTAKKRTKEAVLETKQCPKCFAIYAGPECPECGYTPPPPKRKLQTQAGRLEEIDPTKFVSLRSHRDEEAACNSLAEFRELAIRRGWKPGWAWHRWKNSKKNKNQPVTA